MSSTSDHSTFKHSIEESTKVSKIQICGEGGEYVIIGNNKYYRHELMSLFSDVSQSASTTGRYPTRKITPAPIGLCGIGMTAFTSGIYTSQAMGIQIPNGVIGLACFFGGMTQFLSGFFEFFTGDTFGFTALSSYGAFWMSYGAIFVEGFGISKAYQDPEEFNNAMGIMLVAWAMFTFMMIFPTLKSTVPGFLLFFFLFLTYAFLGAGALSGKVGVTRAGGVIAMITAITAWYNAYEAVANRSTSYFVPPSLPMPKFTKGD
ncbi:mug86 [Candida metapsilosis]|uniref:Mug86 n=1 Tax=Candida metapsilosis TaxID=273372 RepID=A0A8H8DDF2_9ASCO|nr:mug86 [Candida metapsilosis]